MKKTIIVFVIAALVLATMGLWILCTQNSFKPVDILQFGIIILVTGFAILIGIRRLASAKWGEPTEDELSKKIMQKTAAWSYYASLYLWVAMIFVKDHFKWDTEVILGSGIIGMAVIFFVSWTVIGIRGIKND